MILRVLSDELMNVTVFEILILVLISVPLKVVAPSDVMVDKFLRIEST